MSQRISGYDRKAFEHYPTPAWVIDALAEHVDLKGRGIWEPACGTGQMSEAIAAHGPAYVHSTDLVDHGFSKMAEQIDFLNRQCILGHYDGIITNPPYGVQAKLAEAFIRRALGLTRDYGFVAMLLPVDFDSAKTRADIFGDCQSFFAKIVLTKRIKWFEPPGGEKSAGPSQNHAWFVWQRTWFGERQMPRILYAPKSN